MTEEESIIPGQATDKPLLDLPSLPNASTILPSVLSTTRLSANHSQQRTLPFTPSTRPSTRPSTSISAAITAILPAASNTSQTLFPLRSTSAPKRQPVSNGIETTTPACSRSISPRILVDRRSQRKPTTTRP
jgi:hypothetical protein